MGLGHGRGSATSLDMAQDLERLPGRGREEEGCSLPQGFFFFKTRSRFLPDTYEYLSSQKAVLKAVNSI